MGSDIRRLRQWRPVFGRNHFAVMVEGYLDNDMVRKIWRSSVIEYAETPRILVTKNGKKYELIGSMPSKVCSEKGLGYPITILDHFASGFPKNWKEILFEVFNQVNHIGASYSANYDPDFVTPPRKNLNSKSVIQIDDDEPEVIDVIARKDLNSRAVASLDDDEPEVIDVFTPIVPSRKCVSKVKQRQLHFLESSPEDNDKEEKPEKRKRHKAIQHHNVVTKKGKPPVNRRLKLQRDTQPGSAASENQPLVEYPEIEASFDINADHENVPKIKKWTTKEKQNFLNILKRLNPVKDTDWVQVQNFKIDVYRTIEELQEKANELRWKPSGIPIKTFNGQSSNHSNMSMEQVTARPGTIAHIVQLEKVNQHLLKERHKQQSAVARDVSEMFANTKKPVEWDESFVLGSNTPEIPKRYRKGFIPTFGQPRMSVSALDDSTTTDCDQSSSNTSVLVQDEAARQREQTNGLRALKQTKTRTTRRLNSNNQSTFTETTTTTMYSFAVPPPPLFLPRPKYVSTLEEELEETGNEEEEDEFEEEL